MLWGLESDKGTHHEVKSSHQQNHVDKKQPMLLQCDLSFIHKHLCSIGSSFSNALALLIGLCFWKAETEDDDEDWRACTEPEQLKSISMWLLEGI